MKKTNANQIIAQCKEILISESNSKLVQKVWASDIANSLGIFDIYNNDSDERIKSVHAKVWYCTDSWVGLRVYFLDGECFAWSTQQGRKCDEEFTYLSNDSLQKVYQYILSLRDDETPNVKIATQEDIDDSFDEYFTISYSSQIMYNKALYKDEEDNFVEVDILDKAYCYVNSEKFKDKFHDVEISLNGKNKIVHCDDLYFKYCQKF